MAECRQDCEATCVAVCGIEVCPLAAEMGRAVIIIGMHARPCTAYQLSALLPYSLSLLPSSPDLASSLHLPHPLGLAFLSPAPYPFSPFCSFRAR